MTPLPLQRTRRTPYPAGAKVLTVTRSASGVGVFGNPYKIDMSENGEWIITRNNKLVVTGLETKRAAVEYAVKKYRLHLTVTASKQPAVYAAMMRAVWEADYVACFCKIGEPCHRDVLIELATAWHAAVTPAAQPGGESL